MTETPDIDKRGESADPDHDQPEAAEVESARLLANDAIDELGREGLDEEQVRRLAGEYVAQDLGKSPRDFIEWARRRGGGA